MTRLICIALACLLVSITANRITGYTDAINAAWADNARAHYDLTPMH